MFAMRVALGARIAAPNRCVPKLAHVVARHSRRAPSSNASSNLVSTTAQQPRFLPKFPSTFPPSNRGDALTAKRSATVRGARLALPTATRAHRVSIKTRASLSTHVVQSGENLWAISVQRGVSLNELKAANAKALGRSDTIYPGQQLVVPPGGKRIAVPDAYKPQGGTRSTFTSAANTKTSMSSMNPANLAKKQGLGLVTAGAFFIALAVGIWMFKEDERPPQRYGTGDPYGNDPYGQDPYGQQNGGYRQQPPQQGGYYDQYNQGDWPAQNGGQTGGWTDQQTTQYGAQQRAGDYSQPPQWNDGQNNQRY